jgi:hypothetical protein
MSVVTKYIVRRAILSTRTSLLLLTLSIIAFSDNLFTDIDQPSNFDPKFVVHGMFWLAWLGIFAAQALLARSGNWRLHRRLGVAGFLAAIGVTLSTFVIFAAVWKGWDAMPPEVKANRILLPGYALCVLLAWRWRRHGDWHRRLSYVGTLFVLLPILDRASRRFGVSPEAFILVVWNGLFISLFAYDLAARRRIHPVSWGGFACFYGVWTLAAAI